jgi:hypothetical protein
MCGCSSKEGYVVVKGPGGAKEGRQGRWKVSKFRTVANAVAVLPTWMERLAGRTEANALAFERGLNTISRTG